MIHPADSALPPLSGLELQNQDSKAHVPVSKRQRAQEGFAKKGSPRISRFFLCIYLTIRTNLG